MLHINGRSPFVKSGYVEIGKPINSTKKHTNFEWLKNEGYPDETLLLPQRTVVQFNSTYMELEGRHDKVKGSATSWMLIFFGGLGYMIISTVLVFLDSLEKNNTMFFTHMSFILFLMALVLFVTKILLTEIFTYTYFPIRFNRKTRKVYVMQANKKVDVFNWDDLKFYISTSIPRGTGSDIKAVVLADDGSTVTKMFAFPYFSDVSLLIYGGGSTQLQQHFEFVRRYMEAETEEQLTEIKDAIRYTHPVHKKRETPYVSSQRVALNVHHSFFNMEKPKESLEFDCFTIFEIIFSWSTYLGRLIAINTSITPRFSKEIEAECLIDANDKFDLDKFPPVGNVENKPKLKHKILFTFAFIVNSIVMILGMALFFDIIGYGKGVEHDSYFIALLNILTLQWLF